LVYLVCLVCLVEQDELDEQNKPDEPNKPDKQNKPGGGEAIIRRFTRSRNQSGEWCNGTSFGLNDLEALLTVAREPRSGSPLMS
jgi:hypothetical protein